MRKIRLTESGLKSLIKRIINEVDEVQDEIVTISPKEFSRLLKYTNSFNAILNLKKYKDKKVVIDGDLTVRNDKIVTLGRLHGVNGNLDVSYCQNLKSLGELAYVKGNLDFSNTNVSSISDIEVLGRVRDWNSPVETQRLRKEFQKRLDAANERRESGEWDDVENDEMAAKATALLEYMVNNESIDVMDEDDEEQLREWENRLKLLNDQYNETEDDETVEELSREIEEIESNIEELRDNRYDVYDVLPTDYRHYGEMTVFNFRDAGNLNNLKEFAVGTNKECDDALEDYWKNMLDDVGPDGIQQHIIEDNINGDSVAEEFEDWYYDEIRENLDVYFNLDDLELSPEQESRKSDLESYIEELESYIEEMEEKQSSLDDEIEEPDEYSQEYDRIQGLIEEAEKKKEDAQDEIDEMRGEVTEEMIQSEVEDRLYEIRRDPYDYLKNQMGYDNKTIMNYVDMDGVIEDLSRNSDYGDLNSYDGRYDEYKIGGEYYVVMRLN